MGRARTPAMCVGKASKGRCGTHVVHGLPHTLGRSSGCFSGIGAAGSASEDAAEAAAMTERLLLLMSQRRAAASTAGWRKQLGVANGRIGTIESGNRLRSALIGKAESRSRHLGTAMPRESGAANGRCIGIALLWRLHRIGGNDGGGERP